MYPLYSKLFGKLNNVAQSFNDDTLSNVISAFRPTASLLFLIYIGILGFQLFFNLIQEPVKETIVKMLRASVIYSMAMNPAIYNDFFADWLWKLPDALANMILNGQNTDNGSFLDGILSQYFQTYQIFVDEADKDSSTLGIPNLDFLFGGWITLALGIILTAYSAVFVVTAKLALAILLPIGPIFVLTITFDATRKFFDAWIGQILSFAFKVMLLAAILKLNVSMIRDYITEANTLMKTPQIEQLLPIIIFTGISIVVLKQISSMGAALGGGMAIDTLGAFGKTVGGIGNMAKQMKINKPQPLPPPRTTNSISKGN
jgi:type IV secretion system protein VirB6